MLAEHLVSEEEVPGLISLIDGASMCHSFIEAIDDHPYESLNGSCVVCTKHTIPATNAVVWSQVMSHDVDEYIAGDWLHAGFLPERQAA